ncbi:hypothetical protein AMS68_005882 [Peltaster fructicola]|uniref:WW domain-containing protein n=1 Tax=Peltaster fructicola TaxID=286661 RepID=A0A6H0Y0C2_9PEZI|nr:hypothetical protein AMS68_005882 [Peltaster fructicola]
MADKTPSDAPPSYAQATGKAGNTPTASSNQAGPSAPHLGDPRAQNGIPAHYRRSMEDENRPLPEGWVRTYDPETSHQFFVDTTQDPPRSIWTHPHDDPVYMNSLSGEARERAEQESLRHGQPTKADITAEHTDEEDIDDHHTSGPIPGELPPRPEGKGKGKATFGRKLKDKLTGMTHEEREQERKRRAEEERRLYEQHQRLRQAMSKAAQTGERQLLGKDKDGKDVYIEPPRYDNGYSNYGGYPGQPGGAFSYNPYGSGIYSAPNARYMRPAGPYGRPYGGGYGGGYGMPLALGGGLLGDYDQWPIGIAVASDGRIFTTYTRGSYRYTLGVVVNKTAEAPYPSLGYNLPVDQLNTTWNGIAFGSNNSTGFISVQAVYITSAQNSTGRPETLWVLDTGRPTVHNAQGDPSMPYGQPGGPKLVAISLTNNTIYRTYTFPSTVHYPDSYMNDLRFDLRTNVPGMSGDGVAYIVDSSNEGRTAFIVLDLKTGESWRRLEQDKSVLRVPNDVPVYQGKPFYLKEKGSPVSWQQEGLDGIQLTPDGLRIYYSPLTSDYLYSIPTANLRERNSNPTAELDAHSNVTNHGQRGGNANGFEGDSNGLIYQLMPEHNAVFIYDSTSKGNGQTNAYLRDPRIIWPDGASIGADGYIYLNINQLPYQPDWNDGIDSRQYPGAILRAKLPGNGTKISSLYSGSYPGTAR